MQHAPTLSKALKLVFVPMQRVQRSLVHHNIRSTVGSWESPAISYIAQHTAVRGISLLQRICNSKSNDLSRSGKNDFPYGLAGFVGEGRTDDD